MFFIRMAKAIGYSPVLPRDIAIHFCENLMSKKTGHQAISQTTIYLSLISKVETDFVLPFLHGNEQLHAIYSHGLSLICSTKATYFDRCVKGELDD